MSKVKDIVINLVTWLNEKKAYGIIWLLCWAACLFICFSVAKAQEDHEAEYKSSSVEVQAYQDEMRGRVDALEKDVQYIKGGMDILLHSYTK